MATQNFLNAIYERKRRRLDAALAVRSLDDVRAAALALRRGAASNTSARSQPHAFASALGVAGRVNIIAEFKRASPSKGVIRSGVSASEMVKLYEEGGAAAVSVLTEEDYFQGSLRDLTEAMACTSLPVIRKDFIFDEYQVYESAAAGADALLLIAAMLEDDALARLRLLTEEVLGMDALVEVHTAEEMERAEASGAKLIGVNNRDLQTFEVTLDTSFTLGPDAPPGCLLVSESGIRSGDDIARLRMAGFHAFLIGETLMRAEQPVEALQELTGRLSG
ncbi:MAG TPA: indole-3-glycerol phosphate synthase TrpC [Pyrinomonadaceae bacterium]